MANAKCVKGKFYISSENSYWLVYKPITRKIQ